jgi:hypothetical protein
MFNLKNSDEKAVTEIIQSKAILSLVLAKGLQSEELQEAIDAVYRSLDRALCELLEVNHA